ncbi:hypothetical protein ACEPAI_9149 [Sanghuangporus weigelae]
MCKWNPDTKEPESSRWCTHGHTEHEELYNPNAQSRPPVVWCNACWTICAYQSYKEVRKGLLATISDSFNGTTRAPQYIDKFNGSKGDVRRYSEKGTRRHLSAPKTSTVSIPPTHLSAMPPVRERVSGRRMPQTMGAPNALSEFPGATVSIPPAHLPAMPLVQERVSDKRMPQTVPVPDELSESLGPGVTPMDDMPEVDDGYPIYGPLQTHNLARYAEFDEGTEGLR